MKVTECGVQLKDLDPCKGELMTVNPARYHDSQHRTEQVPGMLRRQLQGFVGDCDARTAVPGAVPEQD